MFHQSWSEGRSRGRLTRDLSGEAEGGSWDSYRRGWQTCSWFKCEGYQRSRVQVAFGSGTKETLASNRLSVIVHLCFHTSLASQSAGAKVASRGNLISYTLKVDILCKLAAALLQQSLRVWICSVLD